MQYKWKSQTRHMPVSADVAHSVCEEIASNGELTPKALVDASRPEDAPLHPAFEWNDAVAAERYRETQAQYIIRHIEVVPEVTQTPTRAFVSITREPKGEKRKPEYFYHTISEVMNDENMKQQLLAQAFSDLAAFKRKYITLSELADVFAAIDKLVA